MSPGTDRRDLSSSVGLFISILVRYPEVGTIRFDPKSQTLSFTFLLRSTGCISDDHFAESVRESLEAYSIIEGAPIGTFALRTVAENGIAVLEITRDAASLSQTELALLVGLVRERFADELIIDDADAPGEEDLVEQDELIREMLADLQDGQPERNLIAFRDGGRVLVFNK